MSKKALLYTGFFVALAIGFFRAIRKYIVMKDTISVVQSFSFVNKVGEVFIKKDVEGKVYVAEYFFTTCNGICNNMNTSIRKVYDRFKDDKVFFILSHTCEPERDSVQQL